MKSNEAKMAMRDLFVMSSDGELEMDKHVDDVIANTEAVCKAANTRMCWTAGEAMEDCLVVVKIIGHTVYGVEMAKDDKAASLIGIVRRLAHGALVRFRIDGDAENDYGACVAVTTTVTDKKVEIVIADDDAREIYTMVIAKPEVRHV